MKRNLSIYIFAVSGFIFLVFGLLLTRNWHNNPERVFYAMINNSLSTSSLSRTINQEGSGQSLSQTLQVQTGENNTVTGMTLLTQGEGADKTKVVTESIGTPNEDYIRYKSIDTSQSGADGLPLDFSQVIDVWGQSRPDPSMKRGGELFGEATLGVIPFGYIDSNQRKEFINEVKNLDVFEIDFSKVGRSKVDGRPVYTYSSQIRPDKYIKMLQLFGGFIGTSQLDSLDSETFTENPSFKVTLEIDVWSGQLRSTAFEDNTERTETYTSYGLSRVVSVPSNSVPISELQQRLQSVQ